MHDEAELMATLERSTRTGVHVIGLRLATYGLGFVGSILIARALGPDGRGRYVLPLAILAIVFTLGNLGLEQAQIYLAGRSVSLDTLWANATFVGVFVAALVWGVAATLLLFVDARPAGTPVAWLVASLVQLPFMLHILFWLNILQLAGRVRSGVAAGTVAAGIQTILVVMLYIGDVLTPFLVLVLIGSTNLVIWSILLAVGIRSGLASLRVDRASLRQGIRFGIRAQMGIVFVFLLLRLDQVMVQRILGFEGLGLYSLAVSVAELLWLMSEPFAAALLPHQMAAAGDDDLRLSYATARLALILVASASVVAWVASPWIIRLAFGEAFGDAVWPFRLLLPGVVALAIQRPLVGVMLKRGRPGLIRVFGGGALILNITWNLLLLPRIGLEAAATGSSVSYIFLASAYVVATRRSAGDEQLSLLPRRMDLQIFIRGLRGSAKRSTA